MPNNWIARRARAQDPNDEPAEQMLARLASTEASTNGKRGRRKKDI
ncbi:MAG: hypothetical protein R3B99_15915 [Polyangiales bacterium]